MHRYIKKKRNLNEKKEKEKDNKEYSLVEKTFKDK